MRGIARLFTILAATCGLIGVAIAGPREDGNAAAARGDYAEAMRLYRAAAEQGDQKANNNIGNLYRGGLGVPRDYAEAMRLYRQAAAQGVPQAQFNLGMMASRGEGQAVNQSEALRWFRLAAEQGYAPAQASVAHFFYTGRSGRQDYGEALRWARMAADQSNAAAQHMVAYHYLSGLAVPRDFDEAIRWTRLAAAQAYPPAQNNMGNFYALGAGGVAQDEVEAVRWFRLSAVQGNAEGQYNLGVRYRDGRGLPRDVGEAVRWLRLAAAQGIVPAAEALRDLGGAAAAVPQSPAPNLQVSASAAPAAAVPDPAVGPVRPSSEATPPAANGRRVALVIGVSTYGTLANLANPVNDARALAAALRPLGFDVDLVLDPDQRTMRQAFSRLGQRMASAGQGATGLFFFAGHGVQSRGINYLIPAGAAIQREADLELEAVAADSVLRQMQEAGVSTNIVILDACRNMPLTRSFRTGATGLAQMDAPNGTFISYSTAPGSVAADGSGANSPFASALVREIARPGQPIEAVFRNVRRNVLLATEGQQTPWDASSLVDPFFFAGGS